MKIYSNNHYEKNSEGGIDMIHEYKRGDRPVQPHEHKGLRRPIPPHERKALMSVELDEKDLALLKMVFGDEDTAEAAAEIIQEAPPEIQILAIQLINLIEEEVA